MLVALLRCTGVALAMGVVTTLTTGATARGGSVPLSPRLIADRGWSEETAPAEEAPVPEPQPTAAAYHPVVTPGDLSGSSSIMIPLPDPLWSGAVGLGGLALASAARRALRPA